MTKHFSTLKSAALVLPLFFAVGCTSANVATTQEAKASETTFKTAKPGASVEFSNISGETVTSNKSRKIHVTVVDGYDAGTLRVDIVENPQLSISGAMSYTFNMAGTGANDIVLNVKPLSTGKHYLNYTATAEYGDGQVARASYAVPIYSGVTPQKNEVLIPVAVGQANGEPQIITMDAEETITTDKP